jgi:hypothetical protein
VMEGKGDEKNQKGETNTAAEEVHQSSVYAPCYRTIEIQTMKT